MKTLRWIAVFSGICAGLCAGATGAQTIDFLAANGPDRTCPRLRGLAPDKLRSDADRAAYAICNAIDILREAMSRFRGYQAEGSRTDNRLVEDLRTRLERVALRLRDMRLALEAVRGPGPYFAIRPGDWVVDWDGDGSISAFEKYLLWTPKRGREEFAPRSRFGSEIAYYEENFVSPQIKLDRADIHWAVAYLQFGEALLNLVLSYDVALDQSFEIRLKDPARVSKVAYRNLLGGLRASAQLRLALLQEKDDDDEWIPNPRQKRTSFPLLMDAQTFATWGELLGHMEKLFRGQTLLGGTVASREFPNVRDLAAGLCEPGEGLDLQSLFTNPIREPARPDALKARCLRPTAARPMTGLAAMIAESLKRNAGRTPGSFSGEWMILRHFYWVN